MRSNWRQRVKKVVLDYDQRNGRWTGITRKNIGDAARRAYDGLPVGEYREDNNALPIMLRQVQRERNALAANLPGLQVRAPFHDQSLPLAQVTRSVDVGWETPRIWRWNRRRAITVQAVPMDLATTLHADVVADISAMRDEMAPGYTMEWDDEYRSSMAAQASLIPGMIPAVGVMALIVVGLFNAYRPPLIILCVIPFAAIGITIGLLATGQPFGFVALLGAMSLSGMMIKNATVLLDQVSFEKAEGKGDYEAMMSAALSRLRPVVLAAATTVLGVIPPFLRAPARVRSLRVARRP